MLRLLHVTKSQHMVVFFAAEMVLLLQGMKNPRFLDRGFAVKVWCSSHGNLYHIITSSPDER